MALVEIVRAVVAFFLGPLRLPVLRLVSQRAADPTAFMASTAEVSH